MTRDNKIVLALVILLAGAFVTLFSFAPGNKPKPAAAHEPTPEDLEAVRALPYVQWDPNANTRLVGVTRYNPEKSSPGYNLYTNDHDAIFLMDMKGNYVHKWSLPGRKQCEYAELQEDGNLLSVCVWDGLFKLDWNSNILWHAPGRTHHDFAILPDQDIVVLSQDLPVEYNKYQVIFDSILKVSPTGEVLSHWSTFDNLKYLQGFHPPSPLDYSGSGPRPKIDFYDYYHLNTIETLPDTPLGKRDRRFRAGNLLVCSRHLDWIAILQETSRKVLWSWGPGVLNGPHMPTMLDNGNIMIFDNGTDRGWSRVIEIEPPSGRIVWEYKGNPPKSFFSPWRGSNQLLPNGNILICDAESGRAFETTRRGEIVWEFWNPELLKKQRKRIYRMMRLPVEQVRPLLNAASD